MNVLAKTVLFIISALLISSCTTTPTETKQPQNFSAFKEIEWTLEKIVINGKSYKPLPKTRKPTLYFKSNGIVTGTATINSYFGKIEIAKEGLIDFGTGFGRTMTDTSSKQKEQENIFLDTLKMMNKSFIQGSSLYLSTNDNKTVMIFSRRIYSRRR